jgi:hypothetical protein
MWVHASCHKDGQIFQGNEPVPKDVFPIQLIVAKSREVDKSVLVFERDNIMCVLDGDLLLQWILLYNLFADKTNALLYLIGDYVMDLM